MNRLVLAALLLLGAPGVLPGQAVPEGSQAARLPVAWRRSPTFRIDPFRHLALPHWGYVVSVGGRAENNTLTLADLGAFIVLGNDDEILVGDVIDALGLVPPGGGVGGSGESESGLYVGGPFGSRVRIGFTAQTRGYGGFSVDDDAVALFRDGNAARTEFTLGESRAAALGTIEGGLHTLVRFGPLGGMDGVHLLLGAGARYLRPVAYVSGRSVIAGGGRVVVSGDSLVANLDVEAGVTPIETFGDLFDVGGTGLAADFLVRAEWPTSGLAVEALIANLGGVTVDRFERRTLRVDVATTSLDSLLDVLDTLDMAVRDTVSRSVDLPRIVRFSASAWANRILQLDLAATLPASGEFRAPLAVDLGTTWRLVPTLPLRLGLVLGGHQGLGYSAGFGVETRRFLLRVAGESLGGLFRNARGAGGRFELGVLF